MQGETEVSPRWCSWEQIENLHYYISSGQNGVQIPNQGLYGILS